MSSARIASALVSFIVCMNSIAKGVKVSEATLAISIKLRMSDRSERATFVHSQLYLIFLLANAWDSQAHE